ncbi:MAG: family peptidase [Enterovirga sp.]|nr:family peptidase [Enterovirga sp.]
MRRGLRLALFSAEEWALTGSAQYVAALPAEERDRIVVNVNLDSVAGSPDLAALTSGYAGIEPFLMAAAEECGIPLRLVRPLMENSDHANFAKAGIPAFRLVAGFDDPMAATRLVLTAADTRDLVPRPDLERAASLALAITNAACSAPAETCAAWRRHPSTGEAGRRLRE